MNNQIKAERFPYLEIDQSFGRASLLPYLPLVLTYQNHSIEITGLLDTGATVNVLPYDIGLQLGAIWEAQKTPVTLTGNLANLEARVLILSGTVAQFPSVQLAFAWTQTNDVPVILGQVNFFLEFDVCFYRAQSIFEIKPKDH